MRSVASPEHDFVSDSFIEIAEDLARSEIYGYVEADRGSFDFACHLTQHRSRLIVGQTLRSHAAGIEKDLNKLLHDPEDSVPVYLFSNHAAHFSRIGETVNLARARLADRVDLLRLIPYPVFDADDEDQRKTVYEIVRKSVLDDLLLNVVLGKLTSIDILIFLRENGIAGLELACLEKIGRNGFVNFPSLAKDLGPDIKPTTLRVRVANLAAAGMLRSPLREGIYWLTQRGRVFLKICALLTSGNATTELLYIARHLGLFEETPANMGAERPSSTGLLLLAEISACEGQMGVRLSGGPYEDDPAGTLVRLPARSRIWVER